MAAEFDKALELLADDVSVHGLFLRARTLLRIGKSRDAYETALTAVEESRTDDDYVVGMTLAIHALIRIGRLDQADAALRRIERREWPSEYAESENSYARALHAYASRRYDVAEASLEAAFAFPQPDVRARAGGLQAHLYAARGDFNLHAALLTTALAIPGQRDVYGRANLVFQLGFVAREMGQGIDLVALERAFESIRWTRSIASWKYATRQNLAWRHALDGSYLRAYRLSERAIADGPPAAWLVTSEADYAQFALAAGEPITAATHLNKAVSIAENIDWPVLANGEEHYALLDLAALLSDRDPEKATEMLQRFESVPGPSLASALAHDDRVLAAYNFARGVQRPIGKRGIEKLEAAYYAFLRIGYTWRAAEAAAAIAQVTRDRDWIEIAHELLALYPASWLTKRLVAQLPSRGHHGMTPQQLRVLTMLHRGLTDKQIAAELGCAHRTARNHVSAVMRKMSVKTRRTLVEAPKTVDYEGSSGNL